MVRTELPGHWFLLATASGLERDDDVGGLDLDLGDLAKMEVVNFLAINLRGSQRRWDEANQTHE